MAQFSMKHPRDKHFVVRGAVLSGADKETMPVQMLALLKDKNDEIIVTDEGFQTVEFNPEFEARLIFHLREPAEEIWIHLTSPRTGNTYRLELERKNLVRGDRLEIAMMLRDLVNESPRH
jgi:hypothetical protein